MAAVSLAEYLADADARLDFVRDALAVQIRLHPEIPRVSRSRIIRPFR